MMLRSNGGAYDEKNSTTSCWKRNFWILDETPGYSSGMVAHKTRTKVNRLRHLVLCVLCVDMLLQNCFWLLKDHCAFMLCDVVL